MKYAIKYQKLPYDEYTNVLMPKEVVRGNEKEDKFVVNSKESYDFVTNSNKDSEYVVGQGLTLDDLRNLFCFNGEELTINELLDIFLCEQYENLCILRDGNIMSINLFDLFNDDEKVSLYNCIEGETALYLNRNIINVLNKIDDLQVLKHILRQYSAGIACFDEKRMIEGYDARIVRDGHVTEIEFDDGFFDDYDDEDDEEEEYNVNINLNKGNNTDIDSKEFTVDGLYKYLKENIIGHDKELKQIATVLYMNYKSNPEYGTESILIPGPTGTGKTATFNCAAKYFDVPFKNINTCNLVPAGIVGTSIEDEFELLIKMCNGDIEHAEKSIIVFDEFDKIGVDELDIKKTLVNIFLKVLEGANFAIPRQEKQTLVFNTTMSSKIGIGSFQEAYKKDKNTIGFINQQKSEEVFDKELLIKKGYFSQELLTRFQHFIPYSELTDEDKKRIILESKLSTYLLKKKRFEEQFGIKTIGDKAFAQGVIDVLKQEQKSVRDLSNIINDLFLDIEYELLSNNGKYKTLKLSKETASNRKFDLK